MSERLSQSATFQALAARVTTVEGSVGVDLTARGSVYASDSVFAGLLTGNYTVSLRRGDATHTGYIAFSLQDGTRQGLIGFANAGGAIAYSNDNGGGHLFSGGTVAATAFKATYLEAILTTADPSAGSVKVIGSSVAGHTGILEFHESQEGVRNGYIGFNANGGQMTYGSDNGTGHFFDGGPVTVGDSTFNLDRNGGTQPLVRFDTGDYLQYTRSNNTFTFLVGGSAVASISAASLTAPTLAVDANFYQTLVSGSPRIQFDVNDNLAYDRSSNIYNFNIGGSTVLGIASGNVQTASGVNVVVGGLVTVGDALFALSIAGGNLPTLQFDTGDLLQYDRAANKLYVTIGGTRVASIDSSGNMRLAGTLTQSVTP